MAQTDSEPQDVLAPISKTAVVLIATIAPGKEAAAREGIGSIPGLQRAVGTRNPSDNLICVVGIGSEAWDRLYGEPRPRELHPLPEYRGARHRAPSTPGDLMFHIRAASMGMCFELARQIADQFGDALDFADEMHGFQYFEERDLLGFVDGTENPTGVARARAAITNDDPNFAGGSYVVVQKYVHDLDAWNALSTSDQELAIGRTKLDDIELPDDKKPANSHVEVNTIVDPDGTERKIVRANMPFGNISDGEYGTYYIAYSATPTVIESMLHRMFVGEPAGNHDRILDFSTAVTGTLFFVPPLEFLGD